MRFSEVAIASLAHFDAPIRVPSEELEARLEGSFERLGMARGMLAALSGIRARRFFLPGTQPSEAAAEAARLALAEAPALVERLGLLINTSVCRDFVEPSTASLVHGALGLRAECLNFDLGNACLGFLDGMAVAGTMIEKGSIEAALIVDGECGRYAVESTLERLAAPGTDASSLRSEFATLTLGSGAAAMVLCRAELAPRGSRLVGGVALAASEHSGLCRGQPDRMVTDSTGLLREGLKLAERTWERARQELGWTAAALDLLAIHQVSRVHTERYAELLGVPLEKIYKLYEEHGNIGPAAVPTALSKAAREGRIGPGARVGLMGIGSGLNCAMYEVIW